MNDSELKDFNQGLSAYNEGGYEIAYSFLKSLNNEIHDVNNINFVIGNTYRMGEEFSESQYLLGMMTRKGLGIDKNAIESVAWFQKSADQGFSKAQYEIAKMCERGNYIIQDYVIAHMWYNLSASRGFVKASKKREAISNIMNKSQIEEAQTMARNWSAKI